MVVGRHKDGAGRQSLSRDHPASCHAKKSDRRMLRAGGSIPLPIRRIRRTNTVYSTRTAKTMVLVGSSVFKPIRAPFVPVSRPVIDRYLPDYGSQSFGTIVDLNHLGKIASVRSSALTACADREGESKKKRARQGQKHAATDFGLVVRVMDWLDQVCRNRPSELRVVLSSPGALPFCAPNPSTRFNGETYTTVTLRTRFSKTAGRHLGNQHR